MDDNKKENKTKTSGSTVNHDALMNLANNLINSDNSLNINDLMNILRDDLLMNSGKELGKIKQDPQPNSATEHENHKESELLLVNNQQEKLTNDVSVVPTEKTNHVSDIQIQLANHFTAVQAELPNHLSVIQTEFTTHLSAIRTEVANHLSAIRTEVVELKEQNTKLLEQISYFEKNYKNKNKKKK